MIVGCKKTLVEYRGWVNRNRYYIRIPIRMGGLFSLNDFVQRLTRPEYFPIATSPKNPTQKPHPKAIPQTPHTQTLSLSQHFPTPNHPRKIKSKILHPKILPQFPQSHPHSLHNLPFYLHFPQKSPKFPINSTKSNQKLLIYPKISQKSTKFTPKNHTIFPNFTHLYLKTVAKTPF